MLTVEGRDTRLRVSPRARSLAAARGVSLAGLKGSGPAGRIIVRDIEAAAAAGATKPEAASLPSSGRLVLSIFADASELESLHARLHDSPLELGLRNITIDDMVLFAVTRALPRHLELNVRLDGGAVKWCDSIALGFTVDTPRGQLVPVIRSAERLSLSGLSRECARLAQRSREGTASPGDLSGATFTVTSFGAKGIETVIPDLGGFPPAGLGVGAIALRPVRGSDGAVVHIPHVCLSLAFDRHVVDSGRGASFLQTLAGMLAHIRLVMAQ